jgi:hypothetical protein
LLKEKINDMKKIIINLVVISFLILVPVFAATASAPPPPPPGGPTPGEDAPIGGTVPIGSGIVMLITMGAAYGAKKVYDARKKLQE